VVKDYVMGVAYIMN